MKHQASKTEKMNVVGMALVMSTLPVNDADVEEWNAMYEVVDEFRRNHTVFDIVEVEARKRLQFRLTDTFKSFAKDRIDL